MYIYHSITFEKMPGSTIELKELPIKKYKVSLDLPPEHRWTEVLTDNLSKLTRVVGELDKLIPKGWISYGVEKMLATAAYMNIVYYSAELRAISAITKIPLGKLVILQLYYELNAHCTSIVTNSKQGPCLTRTMDWELPLLKELTIEVEFMKEGRRLFDATTWVGCVGIFTGMKPGAFAVSLNYRRTNDSALLNVAKTILYSWPTSFLIREVLTNAQSYEEAVSVLSNSKIIAPCYFIVASSDRMIECDEPMLKTPIKAPQETMLYPSLLDSDSKTESKQSLPLRVSPKEARPRGCILIRDRDCLAPLKNNPEKLENTAGGYIVQTNHDKGMQGENIIYSRERVIVLDALMCQRLIDEPSKLLENLTDHPIINEETIYTTQMIPMQGFLKTRVFK